MLYYPFAKIGASLDDLKDVAENECGCGFEIDFERKPWRVKVEDKGMDPDAKAMAQAWNYRVRLEEDREGYTALTDLRLLKVGRIYEIMTYSVDDDGEIEQFRGNVTATVVGTQYGEYPWLGKVYLDNGLIDTSDMKLMATFREAQQ